MKKISLLTFLIMGSTILLAKNPIDKESCTLDGVKLYGKVKVVSSFPDFKVKKVSSFENLKVETVKSFPSKCGKWQFVDSFPDFTIQYVDSFPDFTIKEVTSFPGAGS